MSLIRLFIDEDSMDRHESALHCFSLYFQVRSNLYPAFSGFWLTGIQPLVLSLDFKNLAFHGFFNRKTCPTLERVAEFGW